jgi:hypothetical protein
MTVPRGASRLSGGRIRVGSRGCADSFQAGHASSIFVTRSRAKCLVSATLVSAINIADTRHLIFQAGHVRSTFFPGLADKCPCHTHFLRPQSVAIQGTKPRFRAIAGPLQLPLTWKVASSRPRHNRVDGLKQGIEAANLAPAACFRRALPGLDQAQLPRRGIDHAGWIFCAHHPRLSLAGTSVAAIATTNNASGSSACSGR